MTNSKPPNIQLKPESSKEWVFKQNLQMERNTLGEIRLQLDGVQLHDRMEETRFSIDAKSALRDKAWFVSQVISNKVVFPENMKIFDTIKVTQNILNSKQSLIQSRVV